MVRLVLLWVSLPCMLILTVAVWRLIRHRFLRVLLTSSILFVAMGAIANALVVTANGGLMPVESRQDWENAPSVLSGPEARQSLLCRVIAGGDSPPDPNATAFYDGHHREVEEGEHPRLAWLDDRHPLWLCGHQTLYSRGDSLLSLGLVVAAAAAISAFVIWIASFIRRRRAAK